MFSYQSSETELTWQLLYTKPRAETWAEMNLRKQGFVVLSPRVLTRSGFAPLFPRYLFVGYGFGQSPLPLGSTCGVQYVVQFGDRPTLVPTRVIDEIRSRMSANGVVRLEHVAERNSLFTKRERERVRTLVRLAAAGFRIKMA